MNSFLISTLILSLHSLRLLSAENYDLEVEVFSVDDGISAFSQNKFCAKPPPNLDHMRFGIDLAILDLFPPDQKTTFGFRSPIFEHHCNEGRKVNFNQTTYDLPDSFASVTPVSGGYRETKTEVFTTVDEVQRSMKASLGIGDALGAFMLSPSIERIHKTLANTTKNVEKVSAFVSAYRAGYYRPSLMSLSPKLQPLVDKMGMPFAQNPTNYDRFIKRFGTHYFDIAGFGGMLELEVETEKSYVEKTTTTKLGLELQGLFGQFLKAKGATDVKQTKVSSEFKQASKETFRYYGGETNVLDRSDMKNWAPTVKFNPWLFNGELKPISELIKDPTRKREFEKATQAHLDKAFLKRQIATIETVVAKIGPKQETTNLLQEIQKQMNKVQPDHQKVVAIGEDTKYHTSIPKWFSDHVHLCFEWKPINDKCGYYQKGLPRSICAKIGEFTKEFMDQATKEGACYYSWKLDVIGNDKGKLPDYFVNTELCHSWKTHGVKIQCNGKIEDGENCAKVGQRTAPYFDLTYMDDSGCGNRWQIRTPADAPLWLKNLNFCMKWRGEENLWGKEPKNPCGNFYDKPEVCSKSNEWTDEFFDRGRNDRENCFFSWTINHPRIS